MPSFAVFAGLAASCGALVREQSHDGHGRIAAMAFADSLWIANLTERTQEVRIDGIDLAGARRHRLDAGRFVEACRTGAMPLDDGMAEGAQASAPELELDAYAIFRADGIRPRA
ncbi:MAG: hypothetical protein R3C97_17065 [Geminicoccaceae bacterium]